MASFIRPWVAVVAGRWEHFTALDLKDPAHRTVEFYSSNGRSSGAWGRGGLVRGPKGLYAQTADGPYDPAAGEFGETLLELSFKDLRLVGSYTPSNWQYLNGKDLDLGSTDPVIFPFQKWSLLASTGKESVISLLDANELGGTDHHTPLYVSPRYGNDEAKLHDRGIWGSISTWQGEQGQRWLVMSMMGPPSKDAPPFKYSYGDAKVGSMMAFQVEMDTAKGTPMITPIWISREMHAPRSADDRQWSGIRASDRERRHRISRVAETWCYDRHQRDSVRARCGNRKRALLQQGGHR